ncbi:MAG: BatA domain-containing protein [Chlorobi bacterium]|nr:BatA domain-containing protein [Chlorobiota bacterium]
MQFFNPLMLLGLAAAAIPILLHLLNLRKLRRIDFSTLRFLHQLQRSQVRRLKVQQWLLLALRTGIVVFAVIAFARPVITTSLPILGATVRSSVVIVLDNSPSMDLRDEQGQRFRVAIRKARAIVSALRNGDEVALVTTGDLLAGKSVEMTTALGSVLEQLESLPLAYGSVSIDEMLGVAQSLLESAHNAHRELYLIGDFQAHMFRWNDSTQQRLLAERIIVVPVSQRPVLDQIDLAIDSVDAVTRVIEPGKPIEITARIRNNSTKSVTGAVVRLQFNGTHVAQRALDIPAQQVRVLTLQAPAPTDGFIEAVVELEPDASDVNNRRSMAFIVPPMPRVLLIGSQSDVVYVASALEALSEHRSPLVRHVEPTALGTVTLDEYDVLVLTEPLSSPNIERVRAYLEAGRGNTIVFANSRAAAVQQQRFAADLGLGNIELLPPRSGQHYQLGDLDLRHPLFAGVFRTESSAQAMLESPAIEQALVSKSGVVLVGLEHGAFLSEHVIGSGRAIYCAVPPTFAWSALPTSGLFPIIVARATLYLSAKEAVGTMLTVGERCRLPIPSRYSMSDVFHVRDAAGTQIAVGSIRLAGSTIVDLGTQLVPGCIVVRAQQTSEPITAATVNIPSSEAVQNQVAPERVVSYITFRVGSEDVELATDAALLGTLVARQRQRAELWPWLASAAVLCALGEMIVAGRLARRTAA